MDPAELLAETEAAIVACLKSQAYSVAERSQQRARLAELRELRKDLLKEVQQSQHGGQMASVGIIDSPT